MSEGSLFVTMHCKNTFGQIFASIKPKSIHFSGKWVVWNFLNFKGDIIIISLFALENNAHCLKSLQLVSTDYFNS